MRTKNNQIGKTRILRATISIITRGGPVTYHVSRPSNPVLLQGMELPAEASYVFLNTTNQKNFVDKAPVSIGLFFGENGWEGEDISLGEFQLKDFLPAFPDSGKIEIKLAVSADELLSITLLDHITQKYRSIGFIDISNLAPPEIVPKPKADEVDKNKLNFDQLTNQFLNPKPRETGKPHCGKDISQELTISFEEALYGDKKDIEVVSTETCPSCTGSGAAQGKNPVHCVDCQGTGLKREGTETDKVINMSLSNCPTCQGNGWIITDPCRNCKGNGWVKITRSVTLHISECIDSGAEVCLLHQGEPGRYGGLPGHLRIAINYIGHPLITRTGHNLFIHLPVSSNIAKQGGHLRVPAIRKGSSFLLKLPADTQSDATFRVFESDSYVLTARIETYRPAFLFAFPTIKKRLEIIKEWLGNANDYELPGLLNNVRTSQAPAKNEVNQNEKTYDKVVEAMDGSTSAAERLSNQAEFYTRRGIVYADKGSRERALADFNKALELDTNYASAYDNRSILYLSQHDPIKALTDLKKALDLEPNNAGYYYHRGMLYHVQENVAMAMADYNKALELDSTNADFYESRGRLAILQKDIEAAISDFSKALEIDSNNVEIYHKRGVLYQNKNDSVKALVDFNKALELDPGNNSVLSDRGQMYMFQNDLENALADMSKLVERNPENARAYNNRGYVYLLQNNLDKAVIDYNKALELDPKLVPAYNYRGKTYLKQARYKQAVEDFDKSLLLHPSDSYPYLWLGQAYQGLGEKDKAIASYQKFLNVSQNPELRLEAQKQLADLGIK